MTLADRLLALANLLGADVKLVTPKITEYVSNANLQPTGNYWKNELLVSALTVGATLMNPSGAPSNGNVLLVRIDSAAAQTIQYGTAYLGKGGLLTLPTTTVAGKTLTLGFLYKTSNSKWELQSISQEV